MSSTTKDKTHMEDEDSASGDVTHKNIVSLNEDIITLKPNRGLMPRSRRIPHEICSTMKVRATRPSPAGEAKRYRSTMCPNPDSIPPLPRCLIESAREVAYFTLNKRYVSPTWPSSLRSAVGIYQALRRGRALARRRRERYKNAGVSQQSCRTPSRGSVVP